MDKLLLLATLLRNCCTLAVSRIVSSVCLGTDSTGRQEVAVSTQTYLDRSSTLGAWLFPIPAPLLDKVKERKVPWVAEKRASVQVTIAEIAHNTLDKT